MMNILEFILSLYYKYFFKNKPKVCLNINEKADELPLTVVITTYNNSKYCVENLRSVLSQNYSNFKVLLIDDCSTDDTVEKIEEYLNDHPKKFLVTLIKNQQRFKKLANLFYHLSLMPLNEIVIELDGDDYFINENVLKTLNYYYQTTNALVVHASYINYPADVAKKLKQDIYSAKTPKFIVKNNWFRHYPWIYSGIRSYKVGLFQKIKKEDLLSKSTGEFFPVCHDMAMFYPMLEMAGDKIAYIKEQMLLRNIDSPINDFKSYDQQVRISIMKEIKVAKKYKKLSLK